MGEYDNITGFANAEHWWLTYETLFNHPLYRRSNQWREMGVYRIPLEKVRIVVGDDVPQAILADLCAAFFPDLDPAQLLACAERPWQPGYDAAAAARAKAAAKTHAVAPYNMRDNDYDSPAMGTAPTTRHRAAADQRARATLHRLATTWPMWSTASRSCVTRVDRVKAAGALWPDDPGTFDEDGRTLFTWPMGMGGQHEPRDHTGTAALAVTDLDGCFSLKSGVMYVGGSTQGGSGAGGKATLEENSVQACLRGDHIAHVDRTVGHDPVADPDVLVLPEILTVTEDLGDSPGDGFQVRDLSRLRTDHVYFPALSIPYVGAGAPVAFGVLADRWAGRDDDAWAAFWEQHYAARLGAVKAALLIRYGLQLGTPNSQNFLLEFDATMRPTGRIVVRDLGDAMLHTEVVWALFGSGGAPPQTLKNVAGLRSPAVAYECTTLVRHGDYYPGQTGGDHGNSFDYPAGTQFHWHFYSSLGKGGSVATQSNNSTDPNARAAGWRQVLCRNAVWGAAHNRAYVAYLESVLGLPPMPIDWAATPRADRYTAIVDEQQYGQADTLWRHDIAAERTQSAVVHGVLAGADGQDALRRYHAREWTPATFTVTLTGPDGKPVQGSSITHRRTLAGHTSDRATAVTGGTGQVRLPGHPGQYRFTFDGYQNTVLSGSLPDLRLGQQLSFDFVVIDIKAD